MTGKEIGMLAGICIVGLFLTICVVGYIHTMLNPPPTLYSKKDKEKLGHKENDYDDEKSVG